MGHARGMRLALVIGIAVPLVIGLSPIAQAVTPTCFGKQATILGTGHADHLIGTRRADVIVGRGANDEISGLGGNDRVCAGAGADEISGGSGNDQMDGGAGADHIEGSAGNDVVAGGAGDDYLFGQAGNDAFDGGAGWDLALFIDSSAGVTVNLATGEAIGEGTDEMVDMEAVAGSPFDDKLTGGNGSDFLIPNDGDDVVDGGLGADVVGYYPAPGPVTVDLAAGTATGYGTDSLTGIEHVEGSLHDDVLTGDAGVNIIYGEDGNDTISGGDGDDRLNGGLGTDTADGGVGTDQCQEAETVTNCEA